MGGRRFCAGKRETPREGRACAQRRGNAQGGACAEPPFAREEERIDRGVLRAERWGNDRRRGAFARRGGERPQRMRLRAVCFSRGKEKRISRGALRAERRGNGPQRTRLCAQRRGNAPQRMRFANGCLFREKEAPPAPAGEGGVFARGGHHHTGSSEKVGASSAPAPPVTRQVSVSPSSVRWMVMLPAPV